MKSIKFKYWIVFLVGILFSCDNQNNTEKSNRDKSMVLKTEKDFEAMVAEKGLAEAFDYYADENAVLLRRDSVIQGKAAILNYQRQLTLQNISLTWDADFVDVSGNLAYTYGHYTFSAKDSIGNTVESKGIFHTVWKRQTDGTWKYVWD